MYLLYIILMAFTIIFYGTILVALIFYPRKQLPPVVLPDLTPTRRKPEAERAGQTHKVKIADVNVFITTNEYEDGSLAEVFITIDKTGAEMRLIDQVARFLSTGLQYGIPLEIFVKKMRGTYGTIGGVTDDPQFQSANSVLDFLAQWLEDRYLKLDKI